MSGELERSDWLNISQAAGILECSERHARRILARCSGRQLKEVVLGPGRPIQLYHYSAHPSLLAWHDAPFHPSLGPITAAEPQTEGGIAPDDLARAQLRAQAVKEYLICKDAMPEANAAERVCADWASRPRVRTIHTVECLPGQGRNERKIRTDVTVGGFTAGTLRAWARQFLAGGRRLDTLAPRRKGKLGRKEILVPPSLLNIALAWSIKNPRANIAQAIRAARAEWPGEWPAISDATLSRRVRAMDPAGALECLAKYGVSRFRAEHSPDIERSYDDLRFNERWELDDAELDFYVHGPAGDLVRPKIYGIIRCATRQWVAALATAVPVCRDQVRALLGIALASPEAGMPENIIFERGAVACDDYLEELLTTLGIAVHRTSMDGGAIHPDAFPDRAKGHFQGKGLIEANIRRLHALMWDNLMQVGTNERSDAPANLESIKAAVLAASKEGRFVAELSPATWHKTVMAYLERSGNTPHSGLPETWDQAAGRKRNYTPNEYAREKAAGVTLKRMPETYLPLFFQRGYNVRVGKNGFTLNGASYGRLDEGLAAFQGRKVLAFADPAAPQLAYVQELGRTVEAYQLVRAGAEGGAIEIKRRVEERVRNQLEALVADQIEAGSRSVIDITRVLSSMVSLPNEFAQCAALDERAAGITRRNADFIARRRKTDALFAQPGTGSGRGSEPDAPKTGRGLIGRTNDVAAQVAALGMQPAGINEDKFEL